MLLQTKKVLLNFIFAIWLFKIRNCYSKYSTSMLLDNNRRTVITVTIAKYDEARYVIIIIDKYMFYDIITRGKVAFSSERR